LFEPEVKAIKAGVVGAEADQEEQLGQETCRDGHNQKGLTYSSIESEDVICDQRDRGGTDTQPNQIYDQEIDGGGLSAHGVGY